MHNSYETFIITFKTFKSSREYARIINARSEKEAFEKFWKFENPIADSILEVNFKNYSIDFIE